MGTPPQFIIFNYTVFLHINQVKYCKKRSIGLEIFVAKLLHLNKSIIQIHILKAFLPVFWRKKDIFLYKNDIL